MATKLRLPSIPVRTPKNRFQSEQDELNKIGQRVTIPSLDNATGILRYVGEPAFKSGIWAGIELDKQGQGKNDGSIQGKRYFVCAPNSGIFIGLNKIIIHPPTTTTTKQTTGLPITRKSNLPLTRTSSKVPTTSTSTSTRRKAVRTSSVPSIHQPSPTTTEKSPTLQPIKRSTITPTITSQYQQPSSSPSPSTARRSTLTPTVSSVHSPSPSTPPTQSTPSLPPASQQNPSPQLNRKKSSPSPTHKQETSQLYDLLEKVQKERDALLSQMKHKETAWERLVSSKESLSLQVEEEALKTRRLQRELDECQSQIDELQQHLNEKEASLAKNQHDTEQSTQDQRRIEKLESLVRELQADIKNTKDEQIEKAREHQGALDQVRKKVQASEANTASLEKECEELRKAGLETMHAYDHSVLELNKKHTLEIQQKQHQINQLEYTIADLKHKQSTLFDDDEQDIETRLKAMQQSNSSTQDNTKGDQRHRLEEQLELTMTELDSERLTIQSLTDKVEQLKRELNSSRQQMVAMEKKYEALQLDFEKEVEDKKRLTEEADNAFEHQAKAEDDYYQMKLSAMSLEKEYTDLVESNKQLEQAHKQLETDYNQLMDEMMILEKQDMHGKSHTTPSQKDTRLMQEKLSMLEQENENYKKSLALKTTQVSQLSKELAELESIVENRVFGEADLEEQLEAEKSKRLALERELNSLKHNFKNVTISPTTTTSSVSPTEDLNKFCDFCERYGHDLLQCKSASDKMYCDNCDDFGNHTTDDCPNQDETF